MGEIEVVSNDARAPVQFIDVRGVGASGEGKQPCILVTAPSVMLFGNVPVGLAQAYGEQSLQVANIGLQPCTVESLELVEGAGDFSIAGVQLPKLDSDGVVTYEDAATIPRDYELASGFSIVVAVRFRPTALGEANGRIVVEERVTGANEIVALTGTGVEAGECLLKTTPAIRKINGQDLGLVDFGRACRSQGKTRIVEFEHRSDSRGICIIYEASLSPNVSSAIA